MNTASPNTPELRIARELATKAGAVQLSRIQSPGEVQRKDDDSPVTAVDRACEQIIREGLHEAFPNDGFLGEETGNVTGVSGRRWIVDPIDGTRPFIRGIPTFSVLIALEDCHGPLLGVIYLPALQQMCCAQRNLGAWLNEAPIAVSTVDTLEAAMISGLGHIHKAGSAEADAMLSMMRACDYPYGFMDAYSYVLVACGKLDLCVNLLDQPWDCAAAACIVTEAGGTFTDIAGATSVHNGSILLSNGRLHDQALSFFDQSRRSAGRR
jgi:histidinol phosphatase-like enzyme (inositol monophosphatase family)